MDSRIHYVFAGTKYTAEKTFQATWYDGTSKPPADILALLEGDELPNTGSIFVGTDGVLVLPHINRPLLYPDKKFHDYKYPMFLRAIIGVNSCRPAVAKATPPRVLIMPDR